MMNIMENEIPYLVEAKTCGCNEKGKSVSHHFVESSHVLCEDKSELMWSQIQAYERLLKYSKDDSETLVLKNEIFKLKLGLDLMRY
jgi:hypothetical protein